MIASPNSSDDPRVVRHRFVNVDGLRIFYRESGPREAPVVLLLHGFPSASHQFRRLIDKLSGDLRLIAPDYPGFGFSELPNDGSECTEVATFEGIERLIERFIETVGLKRFVVYLFDYGAPIGFRIAVRRPEWIAGIISQNGNAYECGLGPGADRLRPGRRFDSEAVRQSFNVDSTRGKYIVGADDIERIAPDAWVLDQHFLDLPSRSEFLIALLADYPSNVELYPAWQAWLRERQPPLLVAWGRRDPIFVEAGALAFANDVPNAEIYLFDSGHFALDERLEEYTNLIKDFVLRTPLS